MRGTEQPFRCLDFLGNSTALFAFVCLLRELDYASSHAGLLMTHLKRHSGEKSKRCNRSDYATSQASHLRTHLKTNSGEINDTSVILHPLRQAN